MKASQFAIAYLLTALCSLGGVAQRTGTIFPTCETNVTDRYAVGCVKGTVINLRYNFSLYTPLDTRACIS